MAAVIRFRKLTRKLMKATQKLHEMGQSLWLDNITRDLLTSGTLRRYIQEFSVTGLTSNPTIFDHAIKNSHDYDDAIRRKLKEGKSGEALFFELALDDLRQAADLFRPIHDRTNGVDGWVSLGGLATAGPRHGRTPSPRPRNCTPGRNGPTCSSRSRDQGGPARHRGGHLRGRADQRDLAVLPRAICGGRRGVSARHRAADCRRAETRRRLCGFDVHQSVGRRGHGKVPEICVTNSASPSRNAPIRRIAPCSTRRRWQRILNAGARPQRLLWASTGTKDSSASDLLYIKALAAPFTVNTMPEGTLNALAEHGEVEGILSAHGGDCEEILIRFARAGIDIDALAVQLQDEGARSFVKSWKDLMACIASKSESLK